MDMNPIFSSEPNWIFFDCFNTLVDDFDEKGDESGILDPVIDVAVEAGVCSSYDQFRNAYRAWRRRRWSGADWREVLLTDRFCAVLSLDFGVHLTKAKSLAGRMTSAFQRDYPQTLRLTPGVRAMLESWSGRAKLGIVSNFFLPAIPKDILRDVGLRDWFDFVLDSADFGWKKPAPEIYFEGLRRAGLDRKDARQVLFVGDSFVNDFRGPQKAGMQAIYFDRSSDRPLAPAPEGVPAITHWDQFRPPEPNR